MINFSFHKIKVKLASTMEKIVIILSEEKTHFHVSINKLSDVNKNYNDISNRQKFELLVNIIGRQKN